MLYGDRSHIKPHEAAELFWLFFQLDVLPAATWTFDGKYLNANKAFLDLLGYTPEELERGEISWAEMTPREFASRDVMCMEELREQHIALPYEKEYVTKAGKRVPVRIHNATHDLGASGKGIVLVVPLGTSLL